MAIGGHEGRVRSLEELRAVDVRTPGVVFADPAEADIYYRTTGIQMARGGMGVLYDLWRIDEAAGTEEAVVAKLFQGEYLHQLRTDEVSRLDHERNLRATALIRGMQHPNLLPTILSTAIVDNHLTVVPRLGKTLNTAVMDDGIPVGERLQLLIQALFGLDALHRAGILHRDFTLRNILLSRNADRAVLFDFDLALCLDEVEDTTYREHYQGRILGSPGYSVPPEILDSQLMRCRVSVALDIYAAGGALFALFTDALPHGETEDMWGLYLRIADGIVCNGASSIQYPPEVPRPLRPIIQRCLEREPSQRFPDVSALVSALEEHAARVPEPVDGTSVFCSTLRYSYDSQDAAARLSQAFAARRDPTVSRDELNATDSALSRCGYQIQRALGRVKRHPIYLAAPVPALVASGRFPDANTYPKIVTCIDLAGHADPERLVDLWLGGYFPILRSVRQGMMTSLYRVNHDQVSNQVLLFSEYVDDAHFGRELGDFELSVAEGLCLAYLVSRQVRQLHRRGLAHNNVNAGSLLFKVVRESQRVEPAMVGLVEPSFEDAAMTSDVRNLAELALKWVRPNLVAIQEPAVRGRLQGLRTYLQELVTAGGDVRRDVEDLVAALATGIGAIDGNFSLLAGCGGDLASYARLAIQHRLYARMCS